MAQKTTNFRFDPDPDREALDDLARTLKGLAGDQLPDGTTGEPAAEIELQVADLLSDLNGEIVFFNDSGVRTVGITASAPIVAEGRAVRHVTASGADVSGYRYVIFENGPTLYFEETLDLVVRAPERA